MNAFPVILLAAVVSMASGQFLFHHQPATFHHQGAAFHQPLTFHQQVQFHQPQHFAQESQIQQVELRPLIQSHRAVTYNAEQEEQLPAQLKNPFYRDPRIAASLAKESWLTNKEMQVTEREAEKIPRQQIYKIIKDAGFIRRR